MKTKTGKPLLIYSAAVVVIISIIRFFQYVTIIDFRTGFFALGSETCGLILYAAMLVAAAGFIVLSIVGKKNEWTAFTVSADGMSSKATIIPGVAFLSAAAVCFFDAIGMEGVGLFRTVSAYAFAISLIAVGLLLLKSSVPPRVTGVIQIFYALVCFVNATQLFTDDLVIKNRSDNLIVLLILVLGTLFFTASSRFYARLETRNSRMREIILGGFAFMLSGVHVLSKLMAYLFGGDSVKGMDSISAAAVIILLTSGAFIITVCTTTQNKEIDYILPEKKEDEE